MAFRSTVELYGSIILPRLAEGPKKLAELDVPAFAVNHLEAKGLVRSRGYRLGAVGVRVWFLPEDLEILDEEPPSLPLSCAELQPWDWPPDGGTEH